MASSTSNIQEVNFESALSDRYLAYALSTIMSRSLPDVRDGLKPVHRRLLYAMLQLKLDPKTGYKKCARIIGDVIGKYHPHGDSSVYEALVRMAQTFASRYPMVDGQGNFGSVDGDSQAAMRYTEARLTQYATLLLKDIDQNTVDFRPNYDGSDEEPALLPSAVPNILANGTEGIAVGMATSIPPHNLVELCDALLHLIKSPNAGIDTLLKHVKGPDFPTGGVMVEPWENIKKAYETGRGSFRLRAKWEVEELDRGLYRIVITEIPYQVQKRGLIEKMANLYNEKKLPFLETFQDMSAEDIRVVLTPKSRNIDANVIMESLFKLTDLETRVQLNMNVLDSKSVPHVMNIKQVLTEFLEHRRVVTTRRLEYRLGNIENRLEILDGLLIAYLNLDEVIRIIREEDEPKAVMVKKWKLTDNQVEAILNTRLRALRKLEEMEIKKENKELKEERKTIKEILNDSEKLDGVVSDEIKEIKANYNKTPLGKRKTVLSDAPNIEPIDMEAFVEKEPLTVVCSEMGWLRAIKGHNVPQIKYKEGDSEWFTAQVLSNDKIVAFTNHGKFYSVACDKISRGKGDGDPMRLVFDLAQEENILLMFKYNPEEKYLLAAQDGKGFVVAASDILAQTKGGKQVMTCDGNAAFCLPLIGNSVAVVGENRRLVVFPVNEIPEMKRGRGVALQKFKQGKLKDIKIFNIEEGLSWQTKSGKQSLKDLHVWQGKRGSTGRIVLGKLWIDKK
jgi:topoisomerase-4 subunit A